MSERIEIQTLTDGGQQPPDVARTVAAFLAGATQTLDLAQYDFNLTGEAKDIVSKAITDAANRGVKIRFAYNVDHANPIPVPPPPEPDVQLIATLPVQGMPIAGVPDLMHHKYVIRDGADVWTGSLNWTNDSWTRQENVIAIVHSEAIAKAYRIDFDQSGHDTRRREERLRRPALGRRCPCVVHAGSRRGSLVAASRK